MSFQTPTAVLFLDDVDLSADITTAAVIALVAASAIVLNTVIRLVLRLLTRRAVRRALQGRGRWRVRLPRTTDGASAEQRRVQRADAAAHMMSRLSSILVAGLAALIVSKLLGIDPVVLVSSAGFIGAGLAIGGQALIKDWLTGLLVLLEDRYAVGDQITMTVGGNEVAGMVETLGGAGVRLRLEDGTTWHTGHGSVESVNNRSQQLIPHSIEVPSDVWAELDETMIGRQLNSASHDLGLTDVLLLPAVAAETTSAGTTKVVFHASRQLNDAQHRLVADRIAAAGGTPNRQPHRRGPVAAEAPEPPPRPPPSVAASSIGPADITPRSR